MNYLRAKFSHVRAIIPQSAMSAATMLACACDEILMGKQSALGPIDPQITSKENRKYIVFVHPAEFLVTGPDRTILERTILGERLVISPDQIETKADSQRVAHFDVPLAPRTNSHVL